MTEHGFPLTGEPISHYQDFGSRFYVLLEPLNGNMRVVNVLISHSETAKPISIIRTLRSLRDRLLQKGIDRIQIILRMDDLVGGRAAKILKFGFSGMMLKMFANGQGGVMYQYVKLDD